MADWIRVLWVALAASAPLPAQFLLTACMVNSRAYVVGARLPASGLSVRDAAGIWRHTGFNHPLVTALDYDPRQPDTLYLAAGNGCIRAANRGRDWRILTGEEVTELRDVAVDRLTPGTLYIAHPAGIRVSRDGGASWQDASRGIPRKFTMSVALDRTRAGHLVVGTETGLFFSADGGASWTPAGAAGFQVMRIQQSPHDPKLWLAATQLGGLFRSTDGGASWENLGAIGAGRNLYDVAFDPTAPERIAVGGWSVGVAVSADGGKTWTARNAGLPRPDVWSLAFDPARPGRLYAGVHEEALFVSDDAGLSWRKEGLEGTVIYRLTFIPAGGGR